MSRNKTKQIEADELSDIEQLTECLFALNRSVTKLRRALQGKDAETSIESVSRAQRNDLFASQKHDNDTSSLDAIGELSSQIQLTSEEIHKLTKKPTLH